MNRNIIREAIAVSLEELSGDVWEWVVFAKQRNAMREHVIRFVHDFARNRGVIITDDDIKGELERLIAEIRSGKPLIGKVSDERGCSSCGTRWVGIDGDNCPRCDESYQCQCAHCKAVRAGHPSLKVTYTGRAGEG